MNITLNLPQNMTEQPSSLASNFLDWAGCSWHGVSSRSKLVHARAIEAEIEQAFRPNAADQAKVNNKKNHNRAINPDLKHVFHRLSQIQFETKILSQHPHELHSVLWSSEWWVVPQPTLQKLKSTGWVGWEILIEPGVWSLELEAKMAKSRSSVIKNEQAISRYIKLYDRREIYQIEQSL